MKLTKKQQEIVNLSSGEHLVLAPPGTGKTEILSQRISKAIKNGVEQGSMLCLTFTNRAARNMVERVGREVGDYKLFIGNIHGFCNSFLRKSRAVAYGVSILDEDESDIYIKDILSNLNIRIKATNGTKNISSKDAYNYCVYRKKILYNFPQNLIEPINISFADSNSQKDAQELYNRYEKLKRESNFLDNDDLLIETYRYLSNNPPKDTLYRWVEIDEVQDLNSLQWAIIDIISPKSKAHRVFFGDYEQAIFSFMGAKLETLKQIEKSAEVHFLSENFRSPQYLLDLYNRYAKAWLTPKWDFEPISMLNISKPPSALKFVEVVTQHEDGRYSTQYDEVHWIVSKKIPKEPKDSTAILVRTNAQAEIFAKEFSDRGLEFFKVSGVDLFHRKEIKDLLAFFRVIADSSDRGAWIRVFRLYGKIKSLEDSRRFINYLYNIGVYPEDIVGINQTQRYLEEFAKDINGGRVVVFDTETTGLNTERDDIIQIAGVEIIDGEIGDTFEVYIDTDRDLSESQKVHKISKEFLSNNAIDKIEALNRFLEFVGDSPLIAHNLTYDIDILNHNLKRVGIGGLNGNRLYDSIDIAKRLYPMQKSYRLEYLIELFGIEGVNSHNALDDVKATANLIKFLLSKIDETKPKRDEFFNRYERLLNNIKSRFYPIYKAVSSKFSEELSLGDIASMVMGYMNDHLGYKSDEEIYNDIERLIYHMDSRERLKVIDAIKRYIPEYSRYKESDLITGDEKILIATIHKAKGLEFCNVVIPFCTDENFPSYQDVKSNNITESARLLYVAMTRAKRRLYITSHTQKVVKTQYGTKRFPQKPSRFLSPIMDLLQ